MWLVWHKTYIALFSGGFLACYFLAPWVRKLALNLRAFDPVSDRRVQQRRIPTLGGLAIAIPLYVGIGLLYLWPNAISERFFADARQVRALLLGGLVVLGLGVYDDLHGASAWIKLPCEIFAAIIVCVLSAPFRAVSVPFAGNMELGIAAVPATVFWIVLVTNAFNLIDGIDGLAAGVGAFVCGVSFFIAHMYGHIGMMVFRPSYVSTSIPHPSSSATPAVSSSGSALALWRCRAA